MDIMNTAATVPLYLQYGVSYYVARKFICEFDRNFKKCNPYLCTK